MPIAAHARAEGDTLRLVALVASLDGRQLIRDELAGTTADAEALGQSLAARLLERGAAALLEQVQRQENG